MKFEELPVGKYFKTTGWAIYQKIYEIPSKYTEDFSNTTHYIDLNSICLNSNGRGRVVYRFNYNDDITQINGVKIEEIK